MNKFMIKIIQYLFFITIFIILGIEVMYGFVEFNDKYPSESAILKFLTSIVSILIIYEAFVDIWDNYRIKKVNRMTDSVTSNGGE